MTSIGESNIELGATYKDAVSGFQGVATNSTRFLFGCERVSLSKGFKDEDKGEIYAVFDAAQLVRVKGPNNEVKKSLKAIGASEPARPKVAAKTGGDRPSQSAIR